MSLNVGPCNIINGKGYRGMEVPFVSLESVYGIMAADVNRSTINLLKTTSLL